MTKIRRTGSTGRKHKTSLSNTNIVQLCKTKSFAGIIHAEHLIRKNKEQKENMTGEEQKHIAIRAEGLEFKSRAGQIEHDITNGSPPLRR